MLDRERNKFTSLLNVDKSDGAAAGEGKKAERKIQSIAANNYVFDERAQ